MACMKQGFEKGTILNGRYETVAPLNNGSFGMVFVARDQSNGQLVAIKCLTKKSSGETSSNTISVDEKSEELACHALLGSHPNIVNLVDSFETEAHIFIVLEYCSRGDLYEAIRAGTGPLETEHVRDFMLQLVDAVDYAHSKGMYHRDIKPENIFLTEAGTMKLGDFGLATSDKWTFETTVGSDRYMSPEQYDSAGAGYSPEQADVWAIGICLLNILFSRNPFTTPTESDPLFFDFSRDKQSLFDVFPTMSQDAYEVIAQCMSLDPRKRSLAAARLALQRAISFTTMDDPMDDFCSTESRITAHAKREPLRTPSVQMSTTDQGSFPWARALQASPAANTRQLSVIPDEAYESEDLFDAGESFKDWCSVGQQTPSLSSMMGSAMGVSLKSTIALRRASKNAPRANLSPISGSLPIAMTKPVNVPSMASIFGGGETVSKSWSDLWEEDIEEDNAAKEIEARHAKNTRTYSHESISDESTLRLGTTQANSVKSPMDTDMLDIGDIDGDMVADGFFFHDTPPKQVSPRSPRYSPPPRRSSFDKWSALGDRRRAYTGDSEARKPLGSQSLRESNRANIGLGFASFGNGIGLWENNPHISTTPLSQNKVQKPSKDSNLRGSMCSWASKGSRVRDYDVSHRENRRPSGCGDLEWCGGLHSLHL